MSVRRVVGTRLRYRVRSEPLEPVGYRTVDAAGDPAGQKRAQASRFLTNGGRIRVGRSHLTYSTPEVTAPLDALRWGKAGDAVVLPAARLGAAAARRKLTALYRCAATEHYQVSATTPVAAMVRHLMPHLVSRQVICGAGHRGEATRGPFGGFELSYRADAFLSELAEPRQADVSIMSVRDDPAGGGRFRRLAVNAGDANASDTATFLQMGTTSLIIAMIEDEYVPKELTVARPLPELRAVSGDPGLSHRIEMGDGGRRTALEVQSQYFDLACRYLDERFGDDADPQARDVLELWELVLTRLSEDPLLLDGVLDWPRRLRTLTEQGEHRECGDESSLRRHLELDYRNLVGADGRPRPRARDAAMVLVPDALVAAAVRRPPDDTRAYFRGECIRRYGALVSAGSWGSIELTGEAGTQITVMMDHPRRWNSSHVGQTLDRCATVERLIEALSGCPKTVRP